MTEKTTFSPPPKLVRAMLKTASKDRIRGDLTNIKVERVNHCTRFITSDGNLLQLMEVYDDFGLDEGFDGVIAGDEAAAYAKSGGWFPLTADPDGSYVDWQAVVPKPEEALAAASLVGLNVPVLARLCAAVNAIRTGQRCLYTYVPSDPLKPILVRIKGTLPTIGGSVKSEPVSVEIVHWDFIVMPMPVSR